MASVQPAVEGLGQVVSAAEPEPVKTRSERDLGLGPDRAIRSGTTPRSSALLGLDVARLIEAAELVPATARRPSLLPGLAYERRSLTHASRARM